jgi:hypothetical protein
MRDRFGAFNFRTIDSRLRLQDWLIAGANDPSLATAIQDLVEDRAWRSRVIGQDFERFPVSAGHWRGYQVSPLSRRFFLPGRDDARLNTVRTVL